MHEMSPAPHIMDTLDAHRPEVSTGVEADSEVVSTHVLVEQDKVSKLRELSRRTRIAQSEYLREAVDDLLVKYDRKDDE